MKYKRALQYLNSCDPELQVLAIELLKQDSNLRAVTSVIGHKFSVIFDLWDDIRNNKSYLLNSYIVILREIMDAYVSGKNNIYNKDICKYFITQLRSRQSMYELTVIALLFRKSKFYRKHCNKSIKTYMDEYSLEKAFNDLDQEYLMSYQAAYILDIIEQILQTFKKYHES